MGVEHALQVQQWRSAGGPSEQSALHIHHIPSQECSFWHRLFPGPGSCSTVEPVLGGERHHPVGPEGRQGPGQVPGELHKLENSVKDRVTQYVTLQHSGDKEAVDKLLAKYGVVSSRMRATLANVEDVPVDIRPIFQKDY